MVEITGEDTAAHDDTPSSAAEDATQAARERLARACSALKDAGDALRPAIDRSREFMKENRWVAVAAIGLVGLAVAGALLSRHPD